ncbi:MAG: calcium-binding protein [Pseudomonadota bacterium]
MAEIFVTFGSDFVFDLRTFDLFDLGDGITDASPLGFVATQSAGVELSYTGFFTLENNTDLDLTTGEVLVIQKIIDSSPVLIVGSIEPALSLPDALAAGQTARIGDDFALLRSLLGNDDFLTGGSRNDRIEGFGGNDTIDGRSGNDLLFSGNGDDFTRGADGNDIIRGLNGDDSLLGEGGRDRLFGDNGNDILDGGALNDFVRGGNGNDEVRGGFGNDFVRGERGSDTLFGGEGSDRLIGGTQADSFIYEDVAESVAGGRDVIVDFESGLDTIDLRLLDADPSTAGDDALTFIGAGRFSGEAGELRVGGVFFAIDFDGDRRADFVATIRGDNPVEDDFLL